MKTLIVYATNSGGTRVAADLIHDVLVDAGHSVTIVPAQNADKKTFEGYDLVILGSCTWERMDGNHKLEGQLQHHMFALTEKLSGAYMPDHTFAVFGLGDSSYTHFCGSVDRLVEFVRNLGGKLLDHPLRVDGFFFRQQENELRLAKWAKSLTEHLRA